MYLAWQDTAATRQWFPIGRLNADQQNHHFARQIINGINEAVEQFFVARHFQKREVNEIGLKDGTPVMVVTFGKD